MKKIFSFSLLIFSFHTMFSADELALAIERQAIILDIDHEKLTDFTNQGIKRFEGDMDNLDARISKDFDLKIMRQMAGFLYQKKNHFNLVCDVCNTPINKKEDWHAYDCENHLDKYLHISKVTHSKCKLTNCEGKSHKHNMLIIGAH